MRGDLTAPGDYLKGGFREVCVGHFSQVASDKTQGNSLDWLLGRISSIKERSNIEMGFPEKRCCSYENSFLNFPGFTSFPIPLHELGRKGCILHVKVYF